MHPYSQPTMPLAHFANMISYPMIPQNYPYMPSAFQQAFAGNSSYHQQQLAALLPQYKANLSPSNLPQSGTAPASAYGFGNSTNVGSAGNFPLSQQSAPTGYEDVLSSQYKENSHLLALQQQQQQQQQQQVILSIYSHFLLVSDLESSDDISLFTFRMIIRRCGITAMVLEPCQVFRLTRTTTSNNSSNYNKLSKQQEGIAKLSNNSSMGLMATLISISPKQKCRTSASSRTLETLQELSPRTKPSSSCGKTLTKIKES